MKNIIRIAASAALSVSFSFSVWARDISPLFKPAADERPHGAVPSARQLSRDEMDIISIIHFGINTFTDQEWGFGGEDPAKFDPGDVDFDLMMRQAKDAGIDGVIFVAKHHDGFCLWPTKTTEYNITKSPYKGGKGDMVRDAIDAARRQGLRTAVYCSPWDRNTALYGKPEYIRMFREQVKELLTGYGEMFEMWFDGANGGDGWYGGAKEHRWIDRTTYYDWPTTWKMVHEIHPTACIESDVGPDVRWGGNEMGFGGPECWAAYDPKSFQPGKVAMPGDCQNVRDAFLGTRNGKTWMPAEFDVSLRPGWFYHPGEDGRAKDPEHLMDIYFSSTGNGGMMNIGLQPDRKGRIHPDDVKKLKTFGDELEKMLSNDFAKDAEARRTDDGVELAFAREVEFNVVRLMEDCRYGQRIDDFAVDYFDGEWKPFAKGQAVGIRRLLRREETVKATKVRLRIVHCEMTPLLKDFSVMRCGLKRNAWFKDFEKRSFSKDRTIEGRQVKIDLDPNVGKGRYRIDADGDGFRISAFDEECAQAAIRELCAKLRGESAAEDVVEIKAAQHPDKRGGLMLKVRTNGGEWRDAAGRGRVFAHSNLGNWGEKNLLDPVLYHDDDGTWHVYYKDRLQGGKDCHAVSWGKDNLTDWGRQNWVDNDLDRARMKKARAGSGIWRLTKTQVEKLGKSEWHPGCPWHFTLDSAKDDEQRYGEAVREAKPGLRLKFTKKPAYSISSNLMGVFFEDINSSHEVYSTNHVGTYKGHGFRKDIGEALEALKPRFVRFPGGCIVHARDFKSMYHWKETVGPLSERKGKPNFNWGGFQDFALGYYEYFQLCEDIGADALPILPAGVTCPNPQIAMTDAELDQLVADTLDLVEFANGDPRKSKWAKLRADMGHPRPFGLKYIGLGNEEDVNDYFERGFTKIYRAVREKYPKIKIVGTAGPSCGGRDYEEGWRLAKRLKVDIVDEHYYVGPGWYYGNQLFYDDYDRKGPKVYAGEYAAHKEGRVNDMETALALAIHLTNLERNGDIVEMSSYAPLFAKKGEICWSPDLIYFTDGEVELTTDYWVQWLFGNYGGEKYVPHELEIVLPGGSAGRKARTAEGSPRMGALGPDDSQRFYNRFSSSVVRRGKTTIVKLVNSTAFAMPFAADLSSLGVRKGTKARIIELKGAYDDRKSKPESSESRVGPNFERELPPYSLTVIEF